MRPPLLLALLLALAVLAPGCRSAAPESEAVDPRPAPAIEVPRAVDLAKSLAPLVAEFNAHRDSPRVVSLLSPSCPGGLQALREGLLSRPEDEDFHLTVIWTGLYEGDGRERMAEAMQQLGDPRVRFFHDRERQAGRAFARAFLPVAAACDLYLFYPPGAEWQGLPPKPRSWAHQLGRVSDNHCGTGEELAQALEGSLGELLLECR